ncbi:hypothetical protein [Flavobacterium sp. 5]|uniref:hypothetical protein n=1 Tax=Flavobacterium sp. 5 TaxID=2035199 RepID=UPI000CA85CE4|nr:hypothetical protein [Flavobacterium sp. 5]PKB15485.1 hypothetical protein CLU82_0562 [Flavobacterium sp. 5]
MKSILKTLFIIVIIGLHGCSPKLQPYSAEVNFLYKEAQGTIAIKSTGYGGNRADAIMDAQKNAFNVLLFKGIPGTELNVPLIENENTAKSNHADYFKKFFDERNYRKFLMSSTESSNLIKIKGGKKISVDIKINYNSLRKDLENNELIRKFGF